MGCRRFRNSGSPVKLEGQEWSRGGIDLTLSHSHPWISTNFWCLHTTSWCPAPCPHLQLPDHTWVSCAKDLSSYPMPSLLTYHVFGRQKRKSESPTLHVQKKKHIPASQSTSSGFLTAIRKHQQEESWITDTWNSPKITMCPGINFSPLSWNQVSELGSIPADGTKFRTFNFGFHLGPANLD